MLNFLAIVIGAVLIPLAAWRIVGDRRHRDPFLLPSLILTLGFAAGGLATQLTEGGALDWKLVAGAIGLVVVIIRWRAATAA